MYSFSTSFSEYLQEEQKKYPELTFGDIQTLKESLVSDEKLPPLSDKKYLAFLQSCHFDIELTKKTIKRCYKFYFDIPEVFCQLDPLDEEIENNYKCSSIGQMPTANTDSGDRILFMQFKNYNHDMFEYIPLYKYLVMWMEYTLLTYGTFNGLIVVVDSKGLSWRHILKIPLAVSGKMLKYLQVGLPIRLKEIHVLNAGSATQMLMKMISQFADKELTDKIKVHVANSEDIFNYVPKTIMPSEIGGSGKSHNFFNDELYNNLVSFRDIFLQQNEVLNNQMMYMNQQLILDNE